MATGQEVLTAAQGTIVWNRTNQKDLLFDGIYVLEDTVFFKLSDTADHSVGDYIGDPTTAVKAGAFIRPMNAAKFSSITLTSGSVVLIL